MSSLDLLAPANSYQAMQNDNETTKKLEKLIQDMLLIKNEVKSPDKQSREQHNQLKGVLGDANNLNKFLDIQINKDVKYTEFNGEETWLLECQQRDFETLQQIEKNKE